MAIDKEKLGKFGETAIGKLLSDDPLATVNVEVDPMPIYKIIAALGVTLIVAGVIIAIVAKNKKQ